MLLFLVFVFIYVPFSYILSLIIFCIHSSYDSVFIQMNGPFSGTSSDCWFHQSAIFWFPPYFIRTDSLIDWSYFVLFFHVPDFSCVDVWSKLIVCALIFFSQPSRLFTRVRNKPIRATDTPIDTSVCPQTVSFRKNDTGFFLRNIFSEYWHLGLSECLSATVHFSNFRYIWLPPRSPLSPNRLHGRWLVKALAEKHSWDWLSTHGLPRKQTDISRTHSTN